MNANDVLVLGARVKTRPASAHEPHWRDEHGRPVTHADRPVSNAATDQVAPVVVTEANLPGVLAQVGEQIADLTRRTDEYVAGKGMRFAEVEKRLYLTSDGKLVAHVREVDGQQYAEPVSPWAATQASEGDPQVPTLQPMTDAEAERLRAEAIRLQGIIEDTRSAFTERTKASAKLAEIEAKLRAAGRSTELGRAGGPRPQP